MTIASYERQHLSAYAAGYIAADGSGGQGFGCSITKLGTGIFALLFGADSGLVDNNSMTFVSLKGTSASEPLSHVVEDTSNTVKTIYVKNLSVFADAALEVAVFRTLAQT